MDFLEKVEKLPEAVRDFFTSDECRFESEKSFFVYDLESSELEKISKEIGIIFVGDGKLENLPNIILKNVVANQSVAYGIAFEINKRIFSQFSDYFRDSQMLLQQWERMKSNPIVSEEEAYKKLVEVEPWILEPKKEKPVKKQLARLVSLSLSKALKQLPNLGEQAVTSAPIKLKIFPSPVRPSVKNWIEDYRSTMGAEKHGMMERGNYLFHSENGKRLAPGERKKLAEILRSLDEDVTLKVDPERQEIIFEESSVIGSAEKMSNYQFPMSNQDQNPNAVRFSSPHIFPSEKDVDDVNYNLSQKQSQYPAEKNEPKIRGNVVDLKN